MPKKIKNCFDSNLNFNNMIKAHLRARKHKNYKNETIKFEFNLENNITNLIKKIKNDNYTLGDYRTFTVKEPKEREIRALPYVDRIVHQWYIEEFIKPYILPRLIPDTFACIDERGTHQAVNKIQKYMRILKRKNSKYWILKCDIRKFFYTIDPNILFKILSKYISDKKLLKFTRLLIFDKKEVNSIGIPIGNYTSQYFANIYLNELDQYIKNVLKVKYYVRYMDDFILLLNTKEDCKYLKEKIETFCIDNLKLSLNHKSKYYPSNFGLNFCGYKIWTTHKLIRSDSKIKIKRKVTNWNKQWRKNNNINYSNIIQSINSWFGHVSHCNSYNLKRFILRKCDFLYTEFTEIKSPYEE